jgi:hypothetical protein
MNNSNSLLINGTIVSNNAKINNLSSTLDILKKIDLNRKKNFYNVYFLNSNQLSENYEPEYGIKISILFGSVVYIYII